MAGQYDRIVMGAGSSLARAPAEPQPPTDWPGLRTEGVIPCPVMRCLPRRAVILVVLALWALAGPLGGAFGACAAMSAMCEGPCGVCVTAPTPPLSSGILSVVSALSVVPASDWPSASLKVPEPPPKPLLRSA